jgi:outer membrane receptor protein involved in Fe transport
MLEARSQTDITQVADQAPSVTLRQQSGPFGNSLAAFIRGIGQYDYLPAYEPGVGLYVDDVYYATLTGSVLDLLDVDRVEILRGPKAPWPVATRSAALSSSIQFVPKGTTAWGTTQDIRYSPIPI